MVTLWRKFRRDSDGLSLTEALITFPIMLLVISAFVEFSFVLFQWTQTAKALQVAARQLAVSDPLIDNLTTLLEADAAGLDAGDPYPSTIVSASCGAGTTACNSNINRLITGGDGICNPNFQGAPGMCDINPNFSADNVRITYTRAGLGYVGRPGGPVVTITVEARGLSFDLMLAGALLSLDSIPVPATPVTVTSEDLDTDYSD
ncbi:MAG: hypothetical protein R3D78_08770 [Paracoccaceae bacterium]